MISDYRMLAGALLEIILDLHAAVNNPNDTYEQFNRDRAARFLALPEPRLEIVLDFIEPIDSALFDLLGEQPDYDMTRIRPFIDRAYDRDFEEASR